MTSGLLPGTDIARAPGKTRLDLGSLNSSRALPSTPFMEAHYFQNDCFMTPNQLMNEAEKLTGIPGVMVQGRYDLLCPPGNVTSARRTVAEQRSPHRRRRRAHPL